ncbi:MAG: hypothetical protein NTW82_06380 [Bacteroidia bacterium]|nr:hypothetical protein [Bacteroidia bacterium]
MINARNIRGHVFTVILVFLGITGYSQDTDCKVNMPSISGKYTGECKKGLAHGQGDSQGIDRYSGSFRYGLPQGIGTYTWADGSSYEGHWNKGMKDGGGKMVTRDSTYTGIWNEDKYIGKEIISPYKIDRSQNVTKYTFFKSKSTYNVIRIRFFQGAVEAGGLKSVDIAYTSGEQFHDGTVYGIQNPTFPIDVRVKFIADNSFGQAQFEGSFDFTINEPGAWDVRISY